MVNQVGELFCGVEVPPPPKSVKLEKVALAVKTPLPPAPPSEGGINTDNIPASVFTELGKVKDEGFSSTSLSPEILRPKGKDGKTLPEFGSSGYFSAVLQIGESTKDLNEANYGVSDLPEFLSLYAQNEAQFKEADFLRNLGVDQKADLEKADIKNHLELL